LPEDELLRCLLEDELFSDRCLEDEVFSDGLLEDEDG
jgi:hypothetical protein